MQRGQRNRDNSDPDKKLSESKHRRGGLDDSGRKKGKKINEERKELGTPPGSPREAVIDPKYFPENLEVKRGLRSSKPRKAVFPGDLFIMRTQEDMERKIEEAEKHITEIQKELKEVNRKLSLIMIDGFDAEEFSEEEVKNEEFATEYCEGQIKKHHKDLTNLMNLEAAYNKYLTIDHPTHEQMVALKKNIISLSDSIPFLTKENIEKEIQSINHTIVIMRDDLDFLEEQKKGSQEKGLPEKGLPEKGLPKERLSSLSDAQEKRDELFEKRDVLHKELNDQNIIMHILDEETNEDNVSIDDFIAQGKKARELLKLLQKSIEELKKDSDNPELFINVLNIIDQTKKFEKYYNKNVSLNYTVIVAQANWCLGRSLVPTAANSLLSTLNKEVIKLATHPLTTNYSNVKALLEEAKSFVNYYQKYNSAALKILETANQTLIVSAMAIMAKEAKVMDEPDKALQLLKNASGQLSKNSYDEKAYENLQLLLTKMTTFNNYFEKHNRSKEYKIAVIGAEHQLNHSPVKKGIEFKKDLIKLKQLTDQLDKDFRAFCAVQKPTEFYKKQGEYKHIDDIPQIFNLKNLLHHFDEKYSADSTFHAIYSNDIAFKTGEILIGAFEERQNFKPGNLSSLLPPPRPNDILLKYQFQIENLGKPSEPEDDLDNDNRYVL